METFSSIKNSFNLDDGVVKKDLTDKLCYYDEEENSFHKIHKLVKAFFRLKQNGGVLRDRDVKCVSLYFFMLLFNTYFFARSYGMTRKFSLKNFMETIHKIFQFHSDRYEVCEIV